jgi:hypothetical protein
MKATCNACGAEVEWRANPEMCLCQQCFVAKLQEVFPGVRVEGDHIVGIRLKEANHDSRTAS